MTYRKTPKSPPQGARPSVTFTPATPEPPSTIPLPSSAVSLTLGANGNLVIYIPPSPGHHTGSTIFFPADPIGFAALHSLLKERQRAPMAKIGTPAVPTRALAEALERNARSAIAKGAPITNLSPKKLTLSDLDDLDFSELP